MSTQRFVAQAAAIALILASCAACIQSQRAADSAAAAAPAGIAPVVKVSQGEVQGSVADGVAVFKRLPFAAPPVGDLRWREPQHPAIWPGVRAATASSATCVQA
jgi:para-nitrobenzyl esterase